MGRDRPAHQRELHPTCSRSASFTHTSPTGMEPRRSVRTAGGGRGLFCAANIAANSRRILPAFVWIVALVSGSRSRTYPPNEGECGGASTPAERGLRAVRERLRTVARVCTAQQPRHWNTEGFFSAVCASFMSRSYATKKTQSPPLLLSLSYSGEFFCFWMAPSKTHLK